MSDPKTAIITTPDFWDCECKEEVRGDFRYIHPVSQDYCEECCSLEEDMPESRSIEVVLASDIPGHPCFGYTECDYCNNLCAAAIAVCLQTPRLSECHRCGGGKVLAPWKNKAGGYAL